MPGLARRLGTLPAERGRTYENTGQLQLATEIVGGLGLEHGRAILEVLARERGELHMTDAEIGPMCADAAVSMMNSAS